MDPLRYRTTGVGRAWTMATMLAWPMASLAADAGHHEASSPPAAADDAAPARQHGNASFYAKHLHGRTTASGQAYDSNGLTAAHRTLPMGTRLKVVNPRNDKSVIVTVNDRGPVSKNRMLDVSSAAADRLDMKRSGVTKVDTQVLPKDAPR